MKLDLLEQSNVPGSNIFWWFEFTSGTGFLVRTYRNDDFAYWAEYCRTGYEWVAGFAIVQ